MIQLYSDGRFGNIFNEIGSKWFESAAKGYGRILQDRQSRANSLETEGGGREGVVVRGRIGVKGENQRRGGGGVLFKKKRGKLSVSSGEVSLT